MLPSAAPKQVSLELVAVADKAAEGCIIVAEPELALKHDASETDIKVYVFVVDALTKKL
jgi:hypothetical protein